MPLHATLWFGDERGYNATKSRRQIFTRKLWFGDERGYNATATQSDYNKFSCGLVMKEDITQLPLSYSTTPQSCGLVMKEDITQRNIPYIFYV